jgi:hypothetical protein
MVLPSELEGQIKKTHTNAQTDRQKDDIQSQIQIKDKQSERPGQNPQEDKERHKGIPGPNDKYKQKERHK